MNSKTVASNKKARFNFFLEENFVAGLLLEGWEVKSLREGKLNIKEAYVKHIKGELWVVGARIDPAKYINQNFDIDDAKYTTPSAKIWSSMKWNFMKGYFAAFYYREKK